MEKNEQKPKAKEDKTEPKAKEDIKDTYVMCVTHLSWGYKNKNHFYVDKKPLINAKVMGKYANILKVWLENKWIEKGSYKK